MAVRRAWHVGIGAFVAVDATLGDRHAGKMILFQSDNRSIAIFAESLAQADAILARAEPGQACRPGFHWFAYAPQWE